MRWRLSRPGCGTCKTGLRRSAVKRSADHADPGPVVATLGCDRPLMGKAEGAVLEVAMGPELTKETCGASTS